MHSVEVAVVNRSATWKLALRSTILPSFGRNSTKICSAAMKILAVRSSSEKGVRGGCSSGLRSSPVTVQSRDNDQNESRQTDRQTDRQRQTEMQPSYQDDGCLLALVVGRE